MKVSRENKIKKVTPLVVILCSFLVLYACTLFGLLFWAATNAVKGGYEMDLQILHRETYLLPTLENLTNHLPAVFKYFFVMTPSGNRIDIWAMLFNSVYYATTNALASTLVPCVVAYCCARFPFRFSKFVHSLVLVTMIIPIVGNLPASLDMAITLGLYNNLWFYWIMHAHFLGLYFLIFYGAFKAFPASYIEAAKIDGATNMQILLKISVPLISSLFGTVFLLMFISYWNEYQVPYLYLNEFPTIANGFFQVMDGTAEGELNNFPAQISSTLILITPVLVLFLIFQKRLMGSLTVGGLKG